MRRTRLESTQAKERTMADSYLDDPESKYWYNFTTGKVEKGMQSPVTELAGPYDTEAEAAAAPATIAARNAAWDAEDAADDNWGAAASDVPVPKSAKQGAEASKKTAKADDVEGATDDLAGARVDELPVAED